MATAPAIVTLRFCPECGRDDRKSNLPADHVVGNYSMKKCTGKIKTLTYVPGGD